MERLKGIRKRILSLFMALVVTIGCIPFGAESVEAGTLGSSSDITRVTIFGNNNFTHILNIQKIDEIGNIKACNWTSECSEDCAIMNSIAKTGRVSVRISTHDGIKGIYEFDVIGATVSHDVEDLKIGDKYYSSIELNSDSLYNDYGVPSIIIPIMWAHKYQFKEHVSPTCTTEQKDIYACEFCDGTVNKNVHPPLGHNYSDVYTVDVAPTCTNNGSESRHCYMCDAKIDVRPLSKTGHTEVSANNAVAATCTTAGKQSDTKCSVCGATITTGASIPATGHSYTTQVIAPTCTAQGYTKHTCSKCGDTYNDTFTPAKGHSYESTPTFNFLEDGKGCTAVYRCKNCSATTDVNCVVTDSMKVEPTCTKKGITTYTAQAVHPQTGKKSYGTKDVADINKLPHTPTKTKTYLKSNATCTEDAVYYEECSECHSRLDTYWTDEGTALSNYRMFM